MNPTRRKPWVALVLSLLCPGLGHVYCGRIVRGLWLFGLSLLLAPDAVIAALLPPSDGLLVFLVGAGTVAAGLAIFAVVDAWRIARNVPADAAPRDYQRPAVYALFLVVGVVCPAVSVAVLHAHVFKAFRIASGSMEPTLEHGDRILVNRARFAVRPVERGDIVTFRVPGERRTYVKRVIGLPGERVEVKDGRVLVNGEPLPLSPDRGSGGDAGGGVFREINGGRSYRVRLPGPGTDTPAFPETKLPDGRYLVLGDDRSNSADSRQFGPVDRDDLDGPAEYLFLSASGLDRVGVLGRDE